jgi:hypothetical protein
MTKSRRRLSRPEVARTGPIRDFSTLLKEPAAGNASSPRSDAENGSSAAGVLGDTVSESVKLGYSVIQEQIRQGRRIAQQMSEGALRAAGPNKDLAQILQRMLHFSTDFGALLVDLTETMWRLSSSGEPRVDRGSRGDNGPAARDSAPAATNMSFDINARRPTKVLLDLRADANAATLGTPGLHALNGDAAPLTEIAFARGARGQMPGLTVRIPDEQPPGTYTGVVVDRETNEPRGTLSIRLSE